MGYWPAVMQAIKNADVVIFVLDARLPDLSRNKDLEHKLKGIKKEVLLVFNKIDLITKSNLKKLKEDNPNCFFISSQNKKGIKYLRLKLQIIAKSLKVENLEVGIVGYPNVGKSAITNILSCTAKAKVSSKAGTTTGLQWISGTKIKIQDTPGVIPFEDDEVKLGILGAKNPEKLKDAEKVALKIISIYLENSKDKLELFYRVKINELDEYYDIFIKIGEARKFLRKGGVIDEQRTSLTIIKDWQEGKIIGKFKN
jgi:ribosome biogenesis GTPase A